MNFKWEKHLTGKYNKRSYWLVDEPTRILGGVDVLGIKQYSVWRFIDYKKITVGQCERLVDAKCALVAMIRILK